MITIAQVLAGFVVMGIVGSSLEKVGISFQLPRVEAAGKTLESLAMDGPKFVANIVAAFKGTAVK